ncbi:hypothetical protein pb186bvf_009772 [Paramecium bursaria]
MSSQIKWVEITLERSLLEDFQAEIERLQRKKTENKNSCKQVVPFLMNQFYKWSKSRDRDLYNQLKKLKLRKTSKQKKFELGDLQLMFSKWDPDQKTSQQDLWIEFLRFHAVQQVEKSRMIRTEDMKVSFYYQFKGKVHLANQKTPRRVKQTYSLQGIPIYTPAVIDSDKIFPTKTQRNILIIFFEQHYLLKNKFNIFFSYYYFKNGIYPYYYIYEIQLMNEKINN